MGAAQRRERHTGRPGRTRTFPHTMDGVLWRVAPSPRRESSPGARGLAARLRTKRAAHHDRRTGGSPSAFPAINARPRSAGSRRLRSRNKPVIPNGRAFHTASPASPVPGRFTSANRTVARSPLAPLGCLYWANTLSRATPRGPFTPRFLGQDIHFPGSVIPPACHDWARIRLPNRLVLVERLARVAHSLRLTG
jgi:hypothetical protein